MPFIRSYWVERRPLEVGHALWPALIRLGMLVGSRVRIHAGVTGNSANPEETLKCPVMKSIHSVKSRSFRLAPQSGHVSDFWGSVGPLIEPADVNCFQNNSSAPPTLVYGGHPVWKRLQLAKGSQGNLRIARDSGLAARCRRQVSFPSERGPTRRCVFPRIIRQSSDLRAIRAHDGDFAIGLRVVRMESGLVLESRAAG